MALKEGSKAPDFSLKDKDGIVHSLKDFRKDYLVVYFYPKDDTPGCTIEAKQFTKDLESLKGMGVDVVGISGGNEKTKQEFCRKHGLKVLLLSDSDFSVSKKYDVYRKNAFFGKSILGIRRQTFVLDWERKIVKVFEKVTPETHAKEVADFIKSGGYGKG